MPGAMQTLEATPTLSGNKVKWKLCHTNPQPAVCGDSNGTYPTITLTKGQGEYPFQVTIVNDQTGKGIKFADGALVIKKGEPYGPGKEKQIGDVNGGGSKTLKFKDLNSLPNNAHPGQVVISYGLHFTDQNGDPVTSIDPDITNGGTNIVVPPGAVAGGGGGEINKSYTQQEYFTAAAIALIVGFAIGYVVYKFFVAPRPSTRNG